MQTKKRQRANFLGQTRCARPTPRSTGRGENDKHWQIVINLKKCRGVQQGGKILYWVYRGEASECVFFRAEIENRENTTGVSPVVLALSALPKQNKQDRMYNFAQANLCCALYKGSCTQACSLSQRTLHSRLRRQDWCSPPQCPGTCPKRVAHRRASHTR